MKLIIYIFVFAINLNVIYAQDPIYSMGFEQKSTMNPSLIGRDGEGEIRTSIIHRNLYRNFYPEIRGPLHSSNLNVDYSLCNSMFALGLNANNETQGDGFLMTNNFSFSSSIRILYPKNKRNILNTIFNMNGTGQLNLGASFGLLQQKIDWDEFIFSDQLNPIYGNVNTSTNSNMNFVSKISTDVNIGGDYTNIYDGRNESKNAINIGLAFHHINNVNVGILNDFALPTRYTFHYSWIRKRNKENLANSFQLMTRFDKQNDFSNLLLRFNYSFLDELSVGIGYRGAYTIIGNINSPLFLLNIYPSSGLNINFCYEPTIGGANAIFSGNTFEIGIIYRSSNIYCISNGKLNVKGGKSSMGKRIPCSLFEKSKSLPPF